MPRELHTAHDHEVFMTSLSARFVNLPAESVDDEILGGLEQIGTYWDVARVLLPEFSADGRSLVVRHTWSHSEVEPIEEGSLIAERLPTIFARLRRGSIVRIPDTGALTPDWETDLVEFKRSGAKSHLSMPFGVAGTPLGVFTIVAVRERRDWSAADVQRFQLLAGIFANALSRRNEDVRLRSALARIKELQARLEEENIYLEGEVSEQYDFREIVGESSGMKRVLLTIEEVAPTTATVLIWGETGTGKELVARAIHARSTRRERPLIRVNCAALPSQLAESELFGHERGAFTGAIKRRSGRFELAHGGTIFLDEVGDLAPETQAKLLRVLQDGEFERLGSSETRMCDVRVLAATNRDLSKAVEEGTFRADLYYRLRVVPVEVPPLRDRRGDIPALVHHFARRLSRKQGVEPRGVSPESMMTMTSYDWPGNVRELENVIERALILSHGPVITLSDSFVRSHPDAPASRHRGADEELESVERSHILSVLEKCDWKVKGPGNAAERLGLNPSTLRGRMRKLGIERPERVAGET